MKICSVILAGGGGTRFWPLSRQNMPKQLLNISGNDIMINETINRCTGVIPLDGTYIVTNSSQAEILGKVLHLDVPRENVLTEPYGRNTSACIAYAAVVLQKKYGDAVMVVLPSDHYISNERAFREILVKACNLAEASGKLVTIGIKPTFPSTGYGYINYDLGSYDPPKGGYEVLEFVEKPDYPKAKKYVESGSYLWNSGMFVWTVSAILESFERYLPRIYKGVMELCHWLGTEKEAETLERIYSKMPGVSIDYGIMERSDDVLVIPGDFGWNDVGSWDALGAIFPTDTEGNIVKAKHIGINTQNSIIYSSDRLIATIDVNGIIIADAGDALLVCPKNNAQDVKKLVEFLKEQGMKEYI